MALICWGFVWYRSTENPGIFVVRLVMYIGLCLMVGLMFLGLGDKLGPSDIVSRVSLLFYVAGGIQNWTALLQRGFMKFNAGAWQPFWYSCRWRCFPSSSLSGKSFCVSDRTDGTQYRHVTSFPYPRSSDSTACQQWLCHYKSVTREFAAPPCLWRRYR